MASPHKQTTSARKLLYALATLLLLAMAAELLAARYFYQLYGNRKMALREVFITVKESWQQRIATKKRQQANYSNQRRARPDSSAAWNQLVYDEMIAANYFVYDPWVGFRYKDFRGTTLHTIGYQRATIPATAGVGNDTLRIWMLGGSTTFGFNVADAETIPSQLAQHYEKTPLCNRVLEVRNFGIPSFYSYQEYRLFALLLEKEIPPQIVIFLDGFNDLNYAQTAPRWRHFFYHRLAHFMDPSTPEWEPAPTPAVTADSMVLQYQKAQQLISKLAAQNNIEPLFIIQPVPVYNYPQQQTDSACSKTDYPAFALAYPRLEAISATQSNMLYWGNLLQQAPPIPFIDEFHYSPAFNRQLAGLLYDWLKQYLKQQDCK